MDIFILIILIIYLYDFTRLGKQNETMIDQNEKIISLLEEINVGKGNEGKITE